jgi:hypothetical protein
MNQMHNTYGQTKCLFKMSIFCVRFKVLTVVLVKIQVFLVKAVSMGKKLQHFKRVNYFHWFLMFQRSAVPSFFLGYLC